VNGHKCVLNHGPTRPRFGKFTYVRRWPYQLIAALMWRLNCQCRIAVAADWVSEATVTELRPGLLVARTLIPDCDKFAAVPVINVSGREQFLRSDLCLGSAVPGQCLSDSIQAKTLAQNVLLKASGQYSVEVMCETGMRDSSRGGVRCMESDSTGRGRQLIIRNAEVFSRHEYDLG